LEQRLRLRHQWDESRELVAANAAFVHELYFDALENLPTTTTCSSTVS
jgi:hypothetical protein